MEQGFESSAEMDDFGLTESRVRKSLPHDPSSPRFILNTAETQYQNIQDHDAGIARQTVMKRNLSATTIM
jgi:hypothetical protein